MRPRLLMRTANQDLRCWFLHCEELAFYAVRSGSCDSQSSKRRCRVSRSVPKIFSVCLYLSGKIMGPPPAADGKKAKPESNQTPEELKFYAPNHLCLILLGILVCPPIGVAAWKERQKVKIMPKTSPILSSACPYICSSPETWVVVFPQWWEGFNPSPKVSGLRVSWFRNPQLCSRPYRPWRLTETANGRKLTRAQAKLVG